MVAVPTDTLVGLLASAGSATAVAKVLAIKGPARATPIPVLLPNPESVLRVAASFPEHARALAEAHWPGPLTLVLKVRPGALPPAVTAGGPTVGVRVPGPSLALDLLRRLDLPLTGTSANLSGAPPPASVEELAPEVVAAVSLVLPGLPGSGAASAVVDCTGPRPRVLRPGPLSRLPLM